MAVTVNQFGLAQVKVGTGSAGALELLGYTRNYADITKEAFWVDVPGDENGGDQGPPIEIQILGQTARIRCELTKWDLAIAAKVECRTLGGVDGTPATAGTLMFSGSLTMRLLIHSVTGPVNFPRALPRAPIEINKGTKFSTLVVEFEAHKDGSGVLYNATTA